MDAIMARNWENCGIVWHTENVAKKNAVGQRITIAGGQIPEVKDIEKFAAAIAAEGGNIMNVMNASNSPTVKAQGAKRDNPNESGEVLRERVWRTLVGLRSARRAAVTTVTKIYLVDGTLFAGTTRTELVGANMAALVDMGLPPALAREKAEKAADNAMGKAEVEEVDTDDEDEDEDEE
jgi:hypothetical protein